MLLMIIMAMDLMISTMMMLVMMMGIVLMITCMVMTTMAMPMIMVRRKMRVVYTCIT